MTTRLTRRALFRAGAGLTALGALAGCADDAASGSAPRQRMQARAQDEVVPESPTTTAVVPGDPALITGSFRSAAMRGRDTRWVVARPPGVAGDIPVVVILHALNSDERTAFDSSLQMHRYLAQSVAGGTAPFALAAVDAARSYFHPG